MKTFEIKETKKKTSEIMAEMRKLFKVWSYLDDERLDNEFPPPKKITTRNFLYSVEPDDATLGKSAKEADPEMSGITLRERLLMEIIYFKETGNHLDIKGVTLCSGSRYSAGSVPGVYWHSDGVYVYWYNLDNAGQSYGLRSAVSLNSFNSNPEFEPEITEIKIKVGDKEIIFVPK
jgi:hypothetical protein